MSQIETGLHEHFAKAKDQATSTDTVQSTLPSTLPIQQGEVSQQPTEDQAGVAFAKVNSVVTGSPADQAGLKAGDEVRLFGDVNWLNHEKLARVGRTVQRNQGVRRRRDLFLHNIANPGEVRIHVKVSRKNASGSSEEHDVNLVPRADWGGRGMLGCHLLPL